MQLRVRVRVRAIELLKRCEAVAARVAEARR
jgi:hypothetical protein